MPVVGDGKAGFIRMIVPFESPCLPSPQPFLQSRSLPHCNSFGSSQALLYWLLASLPVSAYFYSTV